MTATEYDAKRLDLAFALYGIAYNYHDIDPEIFDNYLLDADDILRQMPHLLSLEEVERLTAEGFFKEEK